MWGFSLYRKGCLPLAVNRSPSLGPDLKDITEAIATFQEQNRCLVVITTRMARLPTAQHLWMEGKALSELNTNGVRTLLGFASVQCGELNCQTMDAAILSLLYALDFQLAEKAWRGKP